MIGRTLPSEVKENFGVGRESFNAANDLGDARLEEAAEHIGRDELRELRAVVIGFGDDI